MDVLIVCFGLSCSASLHEDNHGVSQLSLSLSLTADGVGGEQQAPCKPLPALVIHSSSA